MKYVFYIIIIVLFSIILLTKKKEPIKEVIIERVDTVTIRDTIFKDKPIPKYIKTKPDTIYINDTTFIELPYETKVYKDSTYEAQISGIRASLDYVKLFPTQTTIYKEKVVEIERKQPLIEFKPSIGFGYGILNNKPDFYIGIGITTNF